MSDPVIITMYQGEDWQQELIFYADQGQTQPLPFTSPVMDLRIPGGQRYATFDDSGNREGLATVDGINGTLLLTMGRAHTAVIPAGQYDFDIFADVSGRRRPITQAGSIRLVVNRRITQAP